MVRARLQQLAKLKEREQFVLDVHEVLHLPLFKCIDFGALSDLLSFHVSVADGIGEAHAPVKVCAESLDSLQSALFALVVVDYLLTKSTHSLLLHELCLSAQALQRMHAGRMVL